MTRHILYAFITLLVCTAAPSHARETLPPGFVYLRIFDAPSARCAPLPLKALERNPWTTARQPAAREIIVLDVFDLP